MNWEREIELLTPTFCRGAYQDQPELRPPSIRGMVRWWFRELGGKPDEEKAVFGGMKRFGEKLKDEVMASHLVFRVVPGPLNPTKSPALPHKQGGMANPQAAFAPGGRFRLNVTSRFRPLSDDLRKKAENALELWVLLGALGLRANRGGGSLWPVGDGAPQTPADLRARLDTLGCHWPVCLAPPEAGGNAEELRAAATDTISDPRYEWLFGRARGGRQASVLKFKIVRLDNQLRLLITSREERNLLEAQKCLAGHRCKPEGWKRI